MISDLKIFVLFEKQINFATEALYTKKAFNWNDYFYSFVI